MYQYFLNLKKKKSICSNRNVDPPPLKKNVRGKKSLFLRN